MISDSLRTRWKSYLPAGSLRARYASGAFWMIAGTGTAQFVMAVGGIIVARALGVTGYGELAIVTSTIAMFNIFAELSLGLTTNKHVAEFRKSDPARTGRIIALASMLTFVTGAAVTVLVTIFAEPLATYALRAAEIAPYLRLGAPLLLFGAMNGVQIGTLAGYERFRVISVGRVAMALIGMPLLVAGVLLRGIEGVIVAQIVVGVVSFLWFRRALVRESRLAGVLVSYRHAWKEHGVLLSFALPSMLAGMICMPVIWAANALLVRSPNGMAEMGMFNAANQWRNLVIWIPAAIGEASLPILANLLSERDRVRFIRAVFLSIGMNLLIGLVVAMPISLGSYWIMGLYGPTFSQRWFALVMVCGSAVLQVTINVIGHVIVSASRMWWGLFLNVLWAVEFILLSWYLVRFGADGLASAYVLAYLLHLTQVAAYAAWVLRYDARLTGSDAWPNDVPMLAGATE